MATCVTVELGELEDTLRLDAEYYQPAYLELDRMLDASSPEQVASFASVVTDGIHASPEVVEHDGLLYLSAKCVRNNALELSGAMHISGDQSLSNTRSELHEEDVLVTTVGTIGNKAVVTPEILPANIDRHVGLIQGLPAMCRPPE